MVDLKYAKTVSSISTWVDFFKTARIPVLKQTAEDIAVLQQDEDNVSPRDVAAAVLNDPMMVFKIISYVERHKSALQKQDIVKVEQALIMVGTSTFFNHIPPDPLVEDVLHNDVSALMDMLRIVVRAHRASTFAAKIAAQLADFHAEEVRVAALLHDIAEMLLWCFDHERMQEIARLQAADSSLRSKVAQERILGFRICDLQRELVQSFKLPGLLQALMEEELSAEPRVKNVRAAVNLARHSADGWQNAALPDDYTEISSLLRLSVDKVKHIIGVP